MSLPEARKLAPDNVLAQTLPQSSGFWAGHSLGLQVVTLLPEASRSLLTQSNQ